MRLLDLFCGAGGAAMGYYRAGFDEIVGVDIEHQPNYPFKFVQGNALAFDLTGFDAIHASPPCQGFTVYRNNNNVRPQENLIPATRNLLQFSGLPYVIENVVGAPLIDPILLCGSVFNLNVRRHRMFESNVTIPRIKCDHSWQTPRFAPSSKRKNLRCTVEIGVWRIPLWLQQEAMDIDWMTLEELSEAIPPAYTEYIGKAILSVLERS